MKQGKSIKTALNHYVFFPESSRDNYATIVALHGRGANAQDLVPPIQAMSLGDVLLIAPQAPFELNLGLVQGYAWYDMYEVGTPHPETFKKGLGLLRHFISEVKAAYPIDPNRILLLGFSQGTIMSYAVGLLEPKDFRGIAALSGYVPVNSGLPLRLQELNDFPIFISHGAYDDTIPVRFGRESYELLKKSGADVVYHEYPMGHEVREETLIDLAAWMHRVLT